MWLFSPPHRRAVLNAEQQLKKKPSISTLAPKTTERDVSWLVNGGSRLERKPSAVSAENTGPDDEEKAALLAALEAEEEEE